MQVLVDNLTLIFSYLQYDPRFNKIINNCLPFLHDQFNKFYLGHLSILNDPVLIIVEYFTISFKLLKFIASNLRQSGKRHSSVSYINNYFDQQL